MNGLDGSEDQAAGAAATMDEVATEATEASSEKGWEGGLVEDAGPVEYVEGAAATPERISETKEIVREELGHGIDDEASDVTTELLERVALLDQRTEEHSLVLERLEHLARSLTKSVDALNAGLAQAIERLPKKPGPKPGSKRQPAQAAKGKPSPKLKTKPGPKPKAKKPGPKPKR